MPNSEIDLDTSEETVEFRGRIPRELHDRFITLFPQHGSTNWAINLGVAAIVEIAEADPMEFKLRSFLRRLVREQKENPID